MGSTSTERQLERRPRPDHGLLSRGAKRPVRGIQTMFRLRTPRPIILLMLVYTPYTQTNAPLASIAMQVLERYLNWARQMHIIMPMEITRLHHLPYRRAHLLLQLERSLVLGISMLMEADRHIRVLFRQTMTLPYMLSGSKQDRITGPGRPLVYQKVPI